MQKVVGSNPISRFPRIQAVYAGPRYSGAGGQRQLIAEACERVLDLLASDEEIEVRVENLARHPPGVEAWAGAEGIGIRPRVLRDNTPARVQYLLYEESAHYILAQRGVPHPRNENDFLRALFQETFGSYVQHSLLVEHHPEMLVHMQLKPIPSGMAPARTGHWAGRHLGLALLGGTESEEYLSEWIDDDDEDPTLREFAGHLRDELEGVAGAQDLANELIALYRQIESDD